MGRAIVFVFFFIGFVIFLFIKYAAFGVKAAYHAVNEPETFQKFLQGREVPDRSGSLDLADNSKIVRKADFIAGLVGTQLAFTDYEPGKIPEGSNASDEFSAGYLWGFIDA